MEKTKKKLTPLGLRIASSTHLSGVIESTNLNEAFQKMNLKTDGDGNLTPTTIKRLKTSLRVAITDSPEEIVQAKAKAMLEFLEDY